MVFWLTIACLCFVLCMFLAGIVIPQILLISFRKKLFDVPNARKIHTSLVPRLGGLAFMPVVFFTMVLILGLGMVWYPDVFIRESYPYIKTMSFLACGALLLYVVGMADDLVGVRYVAKFFVQVLSALFMIAGGVWISTFTGILGLEDISPWFGWPFTVVVTVYIINAINLIDGVDGLASGLSSIAFVVYTVTFLLAGEYVFAVLSVGCLGVLVPFFYYNVFGSAEHQKKIFMGDTGSLTIGMMLAFLSIRILQTPPLPQLNYANMAVVAFVPLLIPCFDVLRVYGERILGHLNPFLPDKRHIHHKLMQLGFSTRRVMVFLIIAGFVITVVNVVLSMYINVNFLLFGDMALWALFMVHLSKKIKKRQ